MINLADEEKIIIKQRVTQAFNHFEGTHGLLNELYRYFVPLRNITYSKYQKGFFEKKMPLTSLGQIAMEKEVNHTHWALFPYGESWAVPSVLYKGTERQRTLTRKEDVEQEWDTINKTFFDLLEQTNFHIAINEGLRDFLLAHCIIAVSDDKTLPCRFTAINPACVAFEGSDTDDIENIYRKLEVPLYKLETIWSNIEIDFNLRQKIKNKPSETIKLIDGVVRYENTYIYFVYEETKNKFMVCEEKSYSPFIVSRYSSVAGEVQGRGKAQLILPDLRICNEVMRLALEKGAYDSQPAVVADVDGLVNPEDVLTPNTIINARRGFSRNVGELVKAIEMKGNFDLASFSLEEKRDAVFRTMGSGLIGQRTSGNPRSATEIIEETKNYAIENHSAIARTDKLKKKLYTKAFTIFTNKGHFAKRHLKQLTNKSKIKLTLSSPVAKAKDIQKIQNIASIMEIARAYNVLSVDYEEAIKEIARLYRVGDGMIRSEAQVKELQNAQLQAMVEMQQPQQPQQPQQS